MYLCPVCNSLVDRLQITGERHTVMPWPPDEDAGRTVAINLTPEEARLAVHMLSSSLLGMMRFDMEEGLPADRRIGVLSETIVRIHFAYADAKAKPETTQ